MPSSLVGVFSSGAETPHISTITADGLSTNCPAPSFHDVTTEVQVFVCVCVCASKKVINIGCAVLLAHMVFLGTRSL